MKTITTGFVAAVLTACGLNLQSTPVAHPGQIIGENDLTVVAADGSNLPKGYQRLIDAFGLMPEEGCTVTHIGQGLVLTAGHCFYNHEFAQNICAQTKIQFGLRTGLQPYLETRCTEVLAMDLSETKDYALFRVAEIPRAEVKIEFRKIPKLHPAITIFGHPMRRPLEWSQKCRLDDARAFDAISADFTHQCDTEVASSGSAIISMSSLKIVGIHNGALDTTWNYGTLIESTSALIEAIRGISVTDTTFPYFDDHNR